MIATKFSEIFLSRPLKHPNGSRVSLQDHYAAMANLAEIYSEPFTVERADDVFDDFMLFCELNDLKVIRGRENSTVVILGEVELTNPTIEDVAMAFLFSGERPLSFEPNLVKRHFNEL